MARREDIQITFGGDDSRFNKVARRVGRTGEALKRQFQGLSASVAGFFGSFGVGGAAAVGGVGLAAGLAKLTSDLDELGKTAQSLNTTVESLHQLRFAISQTSTLTDQQFTTALQKLIKHIGHANRGAKESQKIFQELGLDWEYLASLQSDQAFLEVADALNRIPDAYKRAGLSQKIFEESWRELTPTIMTAREELERLMRVQQEMGGPTTEAAAAAAQFNDEIGKLNSSLSALTHEYATPVIGFLAFYIQEFNKLTGVPQGQREELKDRMLALDEQIAKVADRLDWMTKRGKENSEAADGLRQKLEALRKEYWRVVEAIGALDAKQKQIEERQKTPPVAPPSAIPGPKTPKELSDIERARMEESPITTAGAASMRSQALRRFRQGEITQAELYAEMAKIEFKQGKITEGEKLSREKLGQEAYRSTEGDIDLAGPGPGDQVSIKIGFDKERLNEDFRKWAEEFEIRIKVRPELVSDAGIEWLTMSDAHRTGGHP